jgi:peptide/nickel transport system permease protein
MTWSWLWRRLISLLIVLLVVSFLTYLMLDALPGNTATAILGPGATPDSIHQVEKDLELDRPLPVRYGVWLGRAVHGDLGVSYQTGEVVTVAIRSRLSTSLELLLLSQLLAIGIAVPGAMASAKRENSRFDRALSGASFGMIAIPQFAFGILLLTLFAQKLRWFPVSDYASFSQDPLQNLHAMVLPTITLGLPLAGIYYRVLRTDMVQTLRSDHILFARAMGLSERRVLMGRTLRPSSLTLLSVIGLNTAFLLGGAVIVESLFSLPGIGSFLFRAVFSRDFVKVQGAVLIIGLFYVLVNLTVDILLSVLDPRVRLSQSAT